MTPQGEILKKFDELLLRAKRISEKYQKLNADIELKDGKIKILEKEIAEKNIFIKWLEGEVTALKVGTSVERTEEEKKELRQKINEYIREVDKVITRLSAEG